MPLDGVRIKIHLSKTTVFQHKFLSSHKKKTSQKNIISQARKNSCKLLNLLTNPAFRKNLLELLDTFERNHYIRT
jgi:hypothetical protein